MKNEFANHYATLGLDCRCTVAQVRAAYRVLIKQHHPDLNRNSAEALKRTQELNLAHEILSDPDRRNAYDLELNAPSRPPTSRKSAAKSPAITQDVNLRIDELIRGTRREVTVNDPANPEGPEKYELIVPPDTAPGTRVRLQRTGTFAGAALNLRLKSINGFRLKVRGSDLRCDLRISPDKATRGGSEMIQGAIGNLVRVQIPQGVARNEIIRISGEGLPKPRGGRGDLFIRIIYKVIVHISRPGSR